MQGSQIAVNERAVRSPLTLVARQSPGSITGSLKLVGVESKPGILVQSLQSDTSRTVSVDSLGGFKVGGLLTGEYLLPGWADISTIPYRSFPFLRRYAGKAVHFSLGNGSVVTGLDIECNQAAL